MRPLSFRSDELRSLLLRSKIATLDELKQALGTEVDVTVFRKLKPLDYVTSYSHRVDTTPSAKSRISTTKGCGRILRLLLAVRHLVGHRGVICQSFPSGLFRR